MHIPSLQTLRAFEAAARLQSYSWAGDELGLTHGAISRRIRDLEQQVGKQLFARDGNCMVPTPEGRRLLAQVRGALGLLEDIFGKEPGRGAPIPVTASISPALGARWLAPRMPRLRADLPGIKLSLSISSDPVDLGKGIDAGIRYGLGQWPGTQSSPLCSEMLFPVSSPEYRRRHGIETAADLPASPLLRHPWHSWAAWFRAAGLSAGEPKHAAEYGDSSLLLEAAIAGEGAALARGLAVIDALESGTLVRLPGPAIEDDNGYYFVTAPGPREPGLDGLESWLREAMRRDHETLAAMLGG